RVGAHFGLPAARETNPLDHLLDAPSRRRGGVRAEDFKIAAAAQIIVEGRAFENRANFSKSQAAIRGDVMATDAHFAGGGPDLAEHHANGRALTRAVVAEQAVNGAARHMERE